MKRQDNVLISPFSVHTALSMVVPGARGLTKEEMVRTLHSGRIAPGGLQNVFSQITGRKQRNTTTAGQVFPDLQFTVILANRLYAQKKYAFAPGYVDDLKSTFHADAVNVDFSNGGAVQNEINDFVRQKTNNLIPKVLQQPLNENTVMVLVNTLYFKGDWQKKMSKKNLALTFNKGCEGLEKPQDKWLAVTNRMPYLESANLGAKLVQIPYKSREFSARMLIVMPSDENNCNAKEWLEKLQWSSLREEINKMKTTNVALTMPPFEMRYRAEIHNVLPTMGMSQVFKRGEADLSGMVTDPKERLNIDQIIHETKMIVTAYGTEAAAVTALTITRLSIRPSLDPVPMTVDRSFYVAILYGKHNVTEVLPLFVGVVHNV
ncbi:leukocyte elastase inhibitor-like isoform X2 [Varroa jacobsoni]|nr:leukocyte elastase inhibitor-like isoform X2 [Varroa destructor]XP_022689069.1 leukocyte elastase inhibitor-like isoform X2 [Varroa jacobsoni]